MISFSIVIPNFNSGEVIERALRSLVGQQYPQLQLIVVDAQSTDTSRAILERYRHTLDKLIVEKDSGQADGLNKGFGYASGDVHAWLCADDELLPGALAHVAELFTRHPEADVVIGNCERVFPDGSRTITRARPDTWRVIGIHNVVDQPSVFWRATLHARLGALDIRYRLAFDWEFWCRMRDAGASLVTTDSVLSRYHFSETNKSSRAGRQHVDESFRVVRKYGPLGGALALVFLFLYHTFDLRGCYDQPKTCSRSRAAAFAVCFRLLNVVIGRRLLHLYNWHFASCQERGLKWW